MSRVKRGVTTGRRHKRLLTRAKGFRGSRSKLVKRATEAVLHAGQYAFHGRKLKKRNFRSLWINRISEASKALDMPYKDLIFKLKEKKIVLNRKMLAQMVLEDPETFKKVINEVRQ